MYENSNMAYLFISGAVSLSFSCPSSLLYGHRSLIDWVHFLVSLNTGCMLALVTKTEKSSVSESCFGQMRAEMVVGPRLSTQWLS